MKPKPKPSKTGPRKWSSQNKPAGKPMKAALKKPGKSMGTCPVCKGQTVNGVCQKCGSTYD